MKPNQNPCSNLEKDITNKILEYQNLRDDDLLTFLLRHFEPMVHMAANKLSRNYPSLKDDLFQVGQLSLIRSIERFCLDLGASFQAYAMKSMIGVMKNYLRDNAWYLRVPRKMKEKTIQVQKVIDELRMELDRSPELHEIAARLDLSVEETIEVLSVREASQPVSIEAPLPYDGDKTIGDFLSTNQNEYRKVENHLDLSEALNHLEKEEKQVVQLVFVEEKSQRKAATLLGVSQMTVSRIQRRAIHKLKNQLSSEQDQTEPSL